MSPRDVPREQPPRVPGSESRRESATASGRATEPVTANLAPMSKSRRADDLPSGEDSSPDLAASPEAAQDAEIGETYLRHLAHELRASLNTVVGWVELMRARQFAPDTALQAADIITRHSQQQAWLIDCVMDAWRVSLDRLVLVRSPIDPRALARTAVDAVERAATARRVRLDLRDAPSGWRVDGDANRLRLLLVSLLMNAIHFAPADSTIAVTVSAEGDGVAVRIDAASPEGQAPVLPERREQFGAGLGLARALARAHGGDLVTGVQAGAPLFTVALPATRPGNLPGSADERLRGLRVLVVEDDDDVRDVLGTLLVAHGAMPHLAGSAEEALDLLLSEPVDVLLSDLGLPGRGGVELLQTIRRLPAPQGEVPAVAFTALTGEAHEQRARSAGFGRYLTKPLDVEALLTALTEVTPAR